MIFKLRLITIHKNQFKIDHRAKHKSWKYRTTKKTLREKLHYKKRFLRHVTNVLTIKEKLIIWINKK